MYNLLETPEFYNNIFNTISDPLFISDYENGHILQANKAAANFARLPLDELIGKTLIELGGWKNKDERWKFIRRLEHDGHVENLRLDRIFKDRRIVVYIHAAKINFQGRQAILVHMKDETADAVKAEKLQISEQRLRQAEKIALLGHWQYIADSGHIHWSEGMFSLLGYDKSDTKPSLLKFLRRIVPEDRRDVLQSYRNAITRRSSEFSIIFRIRRGFDDIRYIRETGSLNFKERLFVSSMGVLQDVTNEHKLTLDLHKSEQRWRNTFNAVRAGIMLIDRNKRIILANKAVAEIYGVDLRSLPNACCCDVMNCGEKGCDQCAINRAIHTGKTENIEIELPTINKSIMLNAAPVKDQRGNIDYIVHVSHDITKLKETEQMLRHAQKMEAIGTLAGGIAHDFNNILTAIVANTELAMLHNKTDMQLQQFLKRILLSSTRATDLVRQILTISRQSGDEPEITSLTSLVKEILKMLRAAVPATIELRTDISSEDITVYAPTVNIHQIIMNLCTNAYQAMEGRHGILTVKLSRTTSVPEHACICETDMGPLTANREWAHLEVSDTGVGIPPEIVERVFEPYFTTKKRGEGTGLGLALVHSIVKQAQGHIILDTKIGKGTKVNIYLPIAKETNSSEDLFLPEFSKMRHEERIMVIDDEEAISSAIKAFLEIAGFNVQAYSNPSDALAVFSQKSKMFDIIITDMTMPGMTGVELARKIKQLRPDIPIILNTGYADEEVRAVAETAGIDCFLSKPLRFNVLLQQVKKVLNSELPR